MSGWIDFKALRQQLDFAKILVHYGVKLNVKGEQHHGFCPLPNHQGERRSPSFSANLTKGIFQCFGCGAKGNILDFAVLMEKLDPEHGEDLRTVALKLQKQFGLQQAGATTKPQKPTPADDRPRVVNAPLDFELKRLDSRHPYLLGRSFTPDTIAQFGLGFCSRGMLAGRVAIPLHDATGQLVGYAGRLVDDAQVNEDNPKYLFPGTRERDGVVHEFRKTLFVYNGWRIAKPVDDLVVVEGFPSVWWLSQLGFPHVVALMGADCSPTQAGNIVSAVKSRGRVWLMPDGNEAGIRCAQGTLAQVAPHRFVRWVKLDDNSQPTDFDHEELALLLDA